MMACRPTSTGDGEDAQIGGYQRLSMMWLARMPKDPRSIESPRAQDRTKTYCERVSSSGVVGSCVGSMKSGAIHGARRSCL